MAYGAYRHFQQYFSYIVVLSTNNQLFTFVFPQMLPL